ncbi:sensor histidine kinase [Thermoactinospora rubra]|uniref:sensor histidine kinase n=1 Tax=Thermoactinospora rubra TaxID=1088767 RepID=UPI001F0A2D21|nr:histidine kinase [Thermoactinospora rubra]
MREYRWALPSVLLGDGQEGRPVKRSMRDWVVDTVMFLLAAGLALVTIPEVSHLPEERLLAEQVVGALSCAALWLRRRWPVALSGVLTTVSSYFVLAGGASVVALFTATVHRPVKVSAWLLAYNLVSVIPYAIIHPDKDLKFEGTIVLGVVIALLFYTWGILVRQTRQQLMRSLRREADEAAQQARRLERERIAREMHDVLAHRLSILSLHAGALEFRPDAPPAEIARAAAAIRDSAHRALQDLREVIGLLRRPEDTQATPERPQPTLDDVAGLVEECRQAGMDVRLALEASSVPEGLGRSVYRIVQEALTNARKHAPGAPVTVEIAGGPGEGLTVRVRNPVPARVGRGLPGSGSGLIGLTERAELLGGRLTHGHTARGDFLLEAWLPWSA